MAGPVYIDSASSHRRAAAESGAAACFSSPSYHKKAGSEMCCEAVRVRKQRVGYRYYPMGENI